MARQHPVHDTIAALTRVQRMRIEVTPSTSYRVEAPCLLQQLAEAVGLGTETGGRGVPGSRANVALDALDLWHEITHSTHTWARELQLDRTPYRPAPPPEPAPALDRARPAAPAPWWQTLHLADDTPAQILTEIGHRLGPATAAHVPPATARQLIPDPARIHQLPPVGRLLRAVAATATSRGIDPVTDAIHRSTDRWRRQIEAMLHGIQEQRGVRGAACPSCEATTVVDERDDGRYRVPAIVLVEREIGAEQLQWLACLACGWSRGAGELLDTAIATWLATLADIWRRLHRLLPPRRLERTAAA